MIPVAPMNDKEKHIHYFLTGFLSGALSDSKLFDVVDVALDDESMSQTIDGGKGIKFKITLIAEQINGDKEVLIG